MDVRSIRRKRIGILLLILVMLAVVVGGVYMLQRHRKASRFIALRSDGIAAFEAEDYAQAVTHLKPYIDQHTEDIEAWYAYAHSRLVTPKPGFEHVGDALNALRLVLQLDPKHEKANDDLLELYSLIRRDERTVTLADQILADRPDHPSAVRHKVLALGRLERTDEALPLAQQWLEEHPDDLEMRLSELQLLAIAGHTPTEIFDHARLYLDENPTETRRQIAYGVALGLAGQQQAAVTQLQNAVKDPLPDNVSLFTVLRIFDQMQMYPQAADLLHREAALQDDVKLQHEAARRLFEIGRLAEATEALEKIDVTSPQADVQMQVIAVLVAQQNGDAERVAEILAAMKLRDDVPAKTWVAVFEGLWPSEDETKINAIVLLTEALEAQQYNAYLHSLLGDSYAQAEEPALAAEHWTIAADLRPTWAAPHRQLAQSHLVAGRLDNAMAEIEAALVRQPNSLESVLLASRIRAAGLHRDDVAAQRDWLAMLDQIDQAVGTPTATLALRIVTLARLGEIDMVRELVQSAAEADLALSPSDREQIQQVNEQYELNIDNDWLALSVAKTDHAQLQTQALALIESGKSAEAVAMVEAQAGGETQGERLVRARVLDAAADPRAKELWLQIADTHRDDVEIQVAALRSAAMRDDTKAADRLVERLRNITGEDGQRWRVEKARWLLSQQNPQTTEDAVVLLKAVIADNAADFDAHRLYAYAQRMSGRPALAVRALQAALVIRPEALDVNLELAQLYQAMQSNAAANEQLNSVVLNPGATPSVLRQAAMLLAQQGADIRAITVLEELQRRPGQENAVDDLLLATLYRRHNQLDKAEAACERLLQNPTPEGVLFVAGYYADQNRGDRAAEALAKLDALDILEDQKQRILATYYSRYGSPTEALQHLRAAAQAAPKQMDHWRRLVAYELVVGEVDAALRDANEAIKQLDSATSFQLLVDDETLVRRYATDQIWRPVVASILLEAAHQQAAIDALQVLGEKPDDGLNTKLKRLRTIADAHRGYLTLRLALVRTYLEAGDAQAASQLATRAMYANPTSVDAAWLAAESLSAQQRWSEALVAAAQWRQRSVGRSVGADLVAAEARLQMGDVDAAMREIQPHVAEALANPQAQPRVIVSYVRGLISNNRNSEAREVLRPLLGEDEMWRTFFARIAALAISDTAVASSWLSELENHIPADSMHEQYQLAEAWWSLSLRSGELTQREAAERWITRVVESGQASPQAWLLKGIMDELSGRLVEAEEAYRRAIAGDASLAIARNNLAMVLVREGRDLDEAVALAESVVEMEPGIADFFDTLAQAYMAGGKSDRAVAAMEQAVDAAPGDPRWQWKLLDLYEEVGDTKAANKLNTQLHLQHPHGRPEGL